jgi:hypothetical protein
MSCTNIVRRHSNILPGIISLHMMQLYRDAASEEFQKQRRCGLVNRREECRTRWIPADGVKRDPHAQPKNGRILRNAFLILPMPLQEK